MTPSEIAEWHDKVDGVWHHEAAATIRELEARVDEWRGKCVAAELDRLKSSVLLKIATEALNATKDRVMTWPVGEQEHCMCGSRVKDHDIGSGHSPVSMGDHAIDGVTKAINEALARIKEV